MTTKRKEFEKKKLTLGFRDYQIDPTEQQEQPRLHHTNIEFTLKMEKNGKRLECVNDNK